MRVLCCVRITTILFGFLFQTPGDSELEEEMESLQADVRRCQNIKSRANPDVQCRFMATHGDYCFRHHKNPRPFHRIPPSIESDSPLPTEEKAAIQLQRFWKRRAPLRRFTLQGPAANAYELATNDTELYTFDPLSSIPKAYFFSFADEGKRIWAFDIRTLAHYRGTGVPSVNPYTRDPLSDRVSGLIHRRILWLRDRKYQIIHLNTEVLTPEQLWNQKVLDVFLKIEALGYYASCDWFHDLTLLNHIVFYNRLYILWEWRLGLTPAEKEAIVPGHLDAGPRRLFKFAPGDHQEKPKGWWQKINLALMDAMITRSPNQESQKLGAMYVLMALVQVSRGAAYALPWAVEAALV